MKKILMIINTYYQLILAMQMKNTIYHDDYVEVLLSDRSRGAEEVCRMIKEMGVFDKCSFVVIKEFDKNIGLKEKICDCFQIGFCAENRYSKHLKDISQTKFDELMFYNEDYMEIDGVFSMLSSRNNKLSFAMFEEGLLTYRVELSVNKRRKLLETIRRMRKQPCLTGKVYDFYCYYPELYKGKATPKKIPLINPNCTTSLQLKDIFKPSISEYKRKYIFFTSVYDFEGGAPIGEYELVEKVAQLVGNENLLVKTHPRDTRTIYVDNGFNVDKNSIIPWEAIQLSGSFENNVFLSVNSCSVLAGSTMSENPVKTFYMYKLCNISGNSSCIKNAEDVEYLLNQSSLQDSFKMVKIAENIEDIMR